MRIKKCSKLLTLIYLFSFTGVRCMENVDQPELPEPIDASTFLAYFLSLSKTAQGEHIARAHQHNHAYWGLNGLKLLFPRDSMIIPTIPQAYDKIKLGLNDENASVIVSQIQQLANRDKASTVYPHNIAGYYVLNTIGLIPLLTTHTMMHSYSPLTKKPYFSFRFFMKQPNLLVKRINSAVRGTYFPMLFLVVRGTITRVDSVEINLQQTPSQPHINGPKACLYYILLDIAQAYARDRLRTIKKVGRRICTAHNVSPKASTTVTSTLASSSAVRQTENNSQKLQALPKILSMQNDIAKKRYRRKLFTALCSQVIKIFLAVRLATRYETY